MTIENKTAEDKQIMTLLESRVKAVQNKDLDGATANRSETVHLFDVPRRPNRPSGRVAVTSRHSA